MLYEIGDILICKKEINSSELEMSNPNINIHIGDKYIITDKDDYPNNNPCHWYELESQANKNIYINAWNDEDHMVLDENFEKERT
jgi:hypothetical protein